MMGRRERGQGQFFYAFDLDRVMPTDHLVRQINGVLDLVWVHKELPSQKSIQRPTYRSLRNGGADLLLHTEARCAHCVFGR